MSLYHKWRLFIIISVTFSVLTYLFSLHKVNMYFNTSSGWTWVEEVTQRILPPQQRPDKISSQESRRVSTRSFLSDLTKRVSPEVSVTAAPAECPLSEGADCSVCTALLVSLLIMLGLVLGGGLLYKRRSGTRKETDKIELIEPNNHRMSFRKDRNLIKSLK